MTIREQFYRMHSDPDSAIRDRHMRSIVAEGNLDHIFNKKIQPRIEVVQYKVNGIQKSMNQFCLDLG